MSVAYNKAIIDDLNNNNSELRRIDVNYISLNKK